MDAEGPRRVVVGVSGSPNSLAALHLAVREARLTGREIWAVLAWDPPITESAQRTPFPSSLVVEQCRRGAVRQLLTALESAFGDKGDDLPVEGLIARGAPGRALVEVACRDDDILVVGTGHRGVLHRALHSSVARYCVTHASCPVLTVPPSPLQRDLESASRRNTWRLRLDARELNTTDILGSAH